MTNNPKDPFLPTTPDAIKAAREIMHAARFGAIAVIEPATGYPLVTRTNCAINERVDPIFLMSDLAAHTKALLKDSRSSLLLGEPGKGDPLAHPRLTLTGKIHRVVTETKADQYRAADLKSLYLAHHPKAALYSDLPDFRIYQLHIEKALFNAGFGKAYNLTRNDLVDEHHI